MCRAVVVRCMCCLIAYTKQTWALLPLVGTQALKDIGLPDLELRNCSCGSTLSLEKK